MENLFEATSAEFARSVLPLYSGPQVKIRIESGPCEYTVSKNLLCSRSSYFSAMFEGKFQEGEQQTATLEEVKGVVSVQSFEALLQWLYLGRVKFSVNDPDLKISAIIEFVNLADMCSISGMESQMAQQIKELLRANPGPPTQWGTRDDDTNTHCLTSHHIESATYLPVGHPVRRSLAAASVEGFLGHDQHKFVRETREYPEFAADLLQELRGTLNEAKFDKRGAFFQDPISGEELRFGRLCRKRKAPMGEDPNT